MEEYHDILPSGDILVVDEEGKTSLVTSSTIHVFDTKHEAAKEEAKKCDCENCKHCCKNK